MSSLPSSIVSIDAAQNSELAPAQVVHTDGHDRDTTIFHVSTTDDSFGLFGTYDEILAMASNVIVTMYSWVVNNGHTEWLDDRTDNNQDGSMTDDNTAGNSAGGNGYRRSSATEPGAGNYNSYKRQGT